MNFKQALDFALYQFTTNTMVFPHGTLPRKVLKDNLEKDNKIINPDSIINELVKNNYITEDKDMLQITLKGIDFLKSGGYSLHKIYKRINVAIILAFPCALASVIDIIKFFCHILHP